MDLDGTIAFLCLKPKKEVIERMRLLKARGCQLMVATRRPNQFFWFTKLWFIFNRIPLDGLFCVGFERANERKLKIVQKEKIDAFIDNDPKVVQFMLENAVNAFTSLDNIN